MTITLPPDIEDALTQQASRQGITSQEMLVQLLRQNLFPPRHEPEVNRDLSARQAALAAIQSGKYKGPQLPGEPLASERFSAAKQEEKEREERRWTP